MAAIFFSRMLPSGGSPDAGEFADPLRHHAEVPTGADQCFFQQSNVVHGTEVQAFFPWKVAAKVEDGITDELARAMVHVSSAIDFMQLNSAVREHLIAG